MFLAQYNYDLGKTAELNDGRETSSGGGGGGGGGGSGRGSEVKAFHFQHNESRQVSR